MGETVSGRLKAADPAVVRLVCADLDGTLVPYGLDRRPTRRFAEAWAAIPAARRPVLVYASGRLDDDLRRLIPEAGLPTADYLIGGVGSTIAGGADGRQLDAWSAHIAPGWNRSLAEDVMAGFEDARPQPAGNQNSFKSSWYWDDASADDLADLGRRLAEAGVRATVIYSGRHHLDLLPVEADKGKALAWLLRRLGIPLAATVVAGDSGNDAAMFRLDGVRCILPANAADDLGAVVDERRTFFAAGTDADGVIEGLRRYGVLEASATTGR